MKKHLSFLLSISLLIILSCNSDEKIVDSDDVKHDSVASKKDLKLDSLVNKKSVKSTTLVLFGSITNQEAKKIIENASKRIFEVRIVNTTKLTKIDLSTLEEASQVVIGGNKVLEMVNLNKLNTIYYELKIFNNPKLKKVNFPELKNSLGPVFTVKQNSQLEELNFPRLKNCKSTLNFIENDHLNAITFESLGNANDVIIQQNPNLVKVEFNLLEELTSRISFTLNKKLRVISLPKLKNTLGSLVFSKNDSLKEIRIPELIKTSGGFKIIENSELTKIDLPKLNNLLMKGNIGGYHARAFAADDNKKLVTVNMPNLEKVSKMRFSGNVLLEEISLPKLTESGDLSFTQNNLLKAIKLPKLKTLPIPKRPSGFSLMTKSNPKLKTLDLSGLKTFGKLVFDERNNDVLIGSIERFIKYLSELDIRTKQIEITLKTPETDKVKVYIEKIKLKGNSIIWN